MLAPKAPGGGNGGNNAEIHLENPSPCLFPWQIPVQYLVGNGIVRLEVTEKNKTVNNKTQKETS